MSAIAGVFYRDRRPVPDADLAVLSAYNSRFGADGGGTFRALGIALQAHVQHFDMYSEGETQPYQLGSGSVVTWDGRLDNRDDLLLRLHRDLGPEMSDAAIVAVAYEKWGLEALRQLVGDWSLALWDAPNQRVILASDYMVNRPVYYVDLPEVFAWSTSLDALAERFDLFAQPNEEYIAGRLTFGVPPGATPFQSARMLFGRHYMIVAADQPTVLRRYWSFEPSTLRYSRLTDYSDHLRELMVEAVTSRLRANRPVWAHLSGGWDSSSVVCIASRLIDRGLVAAPELRLVTGICPKAPESDQSAYVRAVQRWCGIKTIEFDIFGEGFRFDELLGHPRPFPYVPRTQMESVIQAAGGRVALSGHQGDVVLFKTSLHYSSLLEPLHAGKPLQSLRACLAFGHRRRRTLTETIGLLIPTYLPQSLSDERGREYVISTWTKSRARHQQAIANHFGISLDLVQRTNPHPFRHVDSFSALPFVKRALAATISRSAYTGFFANSDLIPDVRTTHPFTHRPLAEYAMGVPQLAMWEPTFSRAGMRRALEHVLPPEILERTIKEDTGPAFSRAIRPLIEDAYREDVSSWEIVRRHYVDGPYLARTMQALIDGRSENFAFARTCIQLEAWLRSSRERNRTRKEVTHHDVQQTGVVHGRRR